MAQFNVKGMLSGGEVVLIDTRQHWMAAVRYALKPILLFGLVILLALVNQAIVFDGFLRVINTLIHWALVIGIVVAVVWLPIDLVQWWSRRYVLTNRRAMRMQGVLRKSSFDSSLEQINDIGLSQTFIGRQLGYADLTLFTASDTANETYQQLRDGLQFKKAVLDAKEAIRNGTPLQSLPEGFIVKGGTNEASMRADGKIEEAATRSGPPLQQDAGSAGVNAGAAGAAAATVVESQPEGADPRPDGAAAESTTETTSADEAWATEAPAAAAWPVADAAADPAADAWPAADAAAQPETVAWPAGDTAPEEPASPEAAVPADAWPAGDTAPAEPASSEEEAAADAWPAGDSTPEQEPSSGVEGSTDAEDPRQGSWPSERAETEADAGADEPPSTTEPWQSEAAAEPSSTTEPWQSEAAAETVAEPPGSEAEPADQPETAEAWMTTETEVERGGADGDTANADEPWKAEVSAAGSEEAAAWDDTAEAADDGSVIGQEVDGGPTSEDAMAIGQETDDWSPTSADDAGIGEAVAEGDTASGDIAAVGTADDESGRSASEDLTAVGDAEGGEGEPSTDESEERSEASAG